MAVRSREDMSDNINLEILDKAKEWFRNIIAVNHISNTKKLKDSSEFNINPFLGVIYGESNELSGHYKRITSQYHHPVHIGKDFWHRLTGDEAFYEQLIAAIGSIAIEADYSQELEETIEQLAAQDDVKNLAR